jgi:hypothetical protein
VWRGLGGEFLPFDELLSINTGKLEDEILGRTVGERNVR